MVAREYVGNMSSLCGGEFFEYSDGKKKGVRAVRLFNGVYSLVILLDKCMNIYRAEHMGENFAYITKNGLTSPYLASNNAYDFASSFDGGLLYMCGLDNIGSPKGDALQHGNMSYFPAENVRIDYLDDGNTVMLTGEMRYSKLFGSNLVFKRSITLKYLDNSIILDDEVLNLGYIDDEFVLLYHFNLGYPFIDENVSIEIEANENAAVNEFAKKEVDKYVEMSAPTKGRHERVFCHKLKDSGKVRVKSNKKTLSFKFNTQKLPYLVQWKSEACGDYVLGIEPSSTSMKDKLDFTKIKPNERLEYKLVLTFE